MLTAEPASNINPNNAEAPVIWNINSLQTISDLDPEDQSPIQLLEGGSQIHLHPGYIYELHASLNTLQPILGEGYETVFQYFWNDVQANEKLPASNYGLAILFIESFDAGTVKIGDPLECRGIVKVPEFTYESPAKAVPE